MSDPSDNYPNNQLSSNKATMLESDADVFNRICKEVEDVRNKHDSLSLARKSIQKEILGLRAKPITWSQRKVLIEEEKKCEQRIAGIDAELHALFKKADDLERQLFLVKDGLALPGKKFADLKKKEILLKKQMMDLQKELDSIQKQIQEF